jgi:hypothetical protein
MGKAFEEWWNTVGFMEEKYCFECGGLEKEDAYKVWYAASEHWLQVAKDHDQEMQYLIEEELYE